MLLPAYAARRAITGLTARTTHAGVIAWQYIWPSMPICASLRPLRTGNGLLHPKQNLGHALECRAIIFVISQPRCNHQRERPHEEAQAHSRSDVDFTGANVAEPKLRVYLPHGFLLLEWRHHLPVRRHWM